MANCCANFCTITGMGKNTRAVMETLRLWELDQDQGHKLDTTEENEWLSFVLINDHSQDHVYFTFESRWDVPAEALKDISKTFNVEVENSYEEPGNLIFGQILIRNGEVIHDTRLDDKDFDLEEDEDGNWIDPKGNMIESSTEYYENKLENLIPC